MKLSIVIVNFNTFDMTCQCIDSIYSGKYTFEYEVILVDNNSSERNPDDFKRIFPQLLLIKSPGNSGFARGNNQGLLVATGEYVLLLNSDTLVVKGSLEYCVAYMNIHKQIAMLGCQLRYASGEVQLSSFNYKVGLWESLLDNSLIYFIVSRLGYARHRSRAHALAAQEKAHKTQAILGAFMLCRKSAVDQVNILEPDFFMYYEELEWCYRFGDAGYSIYYLPDVYITHLEGGTNAAKFNLDDKNRIAVKTKQQPSLSKMLLIYKRTGKWGLYAYNVILTINVFTNYIIAPFRSKEWQAMQKAYLENYNISNKYRKVVLKYFKPTFQSSTFPFKVSIADELLKVA